MSTMITTNVRMTSENLAITKEMAREMGMSFNGYINWLAKDSMVKLSLGKKMKRVSKKAKLDLRNLVKEAKKIKREPMGASEDDKIIYGIED